MRRSIRKALIPWISLAFALNLVFLVWDYHRPQQARSNALSCLQLLSSVQSRLSQWFEDSQTPQLNSRDFQCMREPHLSVQTYVRIAKSVPTAFLLYLSGFVNRYHGYGHRVPGRARAPPLFS